MVLVASSRSASTALPSEQNHPGRRLEQAAQPTTAGRTPCPFRGCTAAVIPVIAIVLPSPDAVAPAVAGLSPLLSVRGEDLALRLQARYLFEFAVRGVLKNVTGLTFMSPCPP